MARTKPRAPRPEYVNTYKLPPQLRMLIRILEEGPAFRLVEARGGTVLSVPKRATAEHWLAELLGPVAFGKLVEALGGEVIELPKYDAVLRQVRHERVRELLRHCTVSEVALQTNYTRRHVINISNAAREDAAMQGDLFTQIEAEAVAAEADDDAGEVGAHDPFNLSPRATRG